MDLNGGGKRPGADAGDGLDADGVDGQRHQIADRRQQIVVHNLRVPRRHLLAAIRSVIHFVSLTCNRFHINSLFYTKCC